MLKVESIRWIKLAQSFYLMLMVFGYLTVNMLDANNRYNNLAVISEYCV